MVITRLSASHRPMGTKPISSRNQIKRARRGWMNESAAVISQGHVGQRTCEGSTLRKIASHVLPWLLSWLRRAMPEKKMGWKMLWRCCCCWPTPWKMRNYTERTTQCKSFMTHTAYLCYTSTALEWIWSKQFIPPIVPWLFYVWLEQNNSAKLYRFAKLTLSTRRKGTQNRSRALDSSRWITNKKNAIITILFFASR